MHRSSWIDAAHRVAGDAFWRDEAPVALVAAGEDGPDVALVPAGHVLFATSGSADEPKWLALGKPALLASAAAVNGHLDVDEDAVWALALPVHHVGGFGVVARARAANCRLACFAGPWMAEEFVQWLDDCGATHTSLVPTQVHDLLVLGARAPWALRAVVVGGGRLDAAVGEAARSLGWPVLASYGMTEAGSQVATQPLQALEHPYCPAPIPLLPHWEARVDSAGCLEIRGPALFSGVLKGGDYHPRAGEWHSTRDLAALGPDGLTPLGRADALVKIAGELVDPLAIEGKLAASCGGSIGPFAVVAVADTRLGSRLVVVVERPADAAMAGDFLAAHNARVPRSQRVGGPLLVDAIPRGTLGKIRRSALSRLVAAGLARVTR
jgi:O-succinylbenzoic acid--CoA ligase